MPIKIGVDATPLLGQRAGTGQYTGHLLAALLKTQVDRSFLLYSHRHLPALESELDRAVRVTHGIPLGSGSRWLWMQLVLPWVIQRTQPDMCHFTNEVAPLLCLKPYVVTIHDASLFLYGRYHPRARLLYCVALVPLVAQRAKAVITVSEHARRDLVRVLHLPPEKVHVVHEAAAAHFQPVTNRTCLASLRKKYRLPEEFLLYVGTCEPRKNLRRLVRAFARLRRAGHSHRLVMVGPAGWLMQGFAREIERLGLQDTIQQLGYIPRDDLAGIYSLATVFVYPSLYEGFGLPPLEAMACGTPVLTGDNSALAEIYAGAAQLVDAEDEEMLTDSLHMLLSDAEWRAELSSRGLRRAKLFSWERAAAETTGIYNRVLAQSS